MAAILGLFFSRGPSLGLSDSLACSPQRPAHAVRLARIAAFPRWAAATVSSHSPTASLPCRLVVGIVEVPASLFVRNTYAPHASDSCRCRRPDRLRRRAETKDQGLD